MDRRRGGLAAAALLFVALLVLPSLPATGQESAAPSPILTLDPERLYVRSRAAASGLAAIEIRAEALAAENREIEATLAAEELELTEKRPDMEPAAFRELADAFDMKVQEIRDEQDAKARDLQRLRDEERQAFLQRARPVLAEIARERGAYIVLDRRSVFLSAEQVDITDEAIQRMDGELEDGSISDSGPDAERPPETGAVQEIQVQ